MFWFHHVCYDNVFLSLNSTLIYVVLHTFLLCADKNFLLTYLLTYLLTDKHVLQWQQWESSWPRQRVPVLSMEYPGGHSQRYEPSVLTQRPLLHTPGTTTHSSMSTHIYIRIYRFLSGCEEAENHTSRLVEPRNFPQPRNTTLLPEF